MYLSPPTRKGLHFYPEYVDALDDIKVMELLERCGCGGYFVWDALKKRIYHDGYFINADVERLAFAIVRTSGGKLKKDFVKQVIYSCAEIGLLDKKLLSQGIITSVEIQRCWESAKAAARSKATIEEYSLLGNDSAAGLGSPCPNDNDNAAITPDNAAITPDNNEPNDTKQIKEINEIDSCCANARVVAEFSSRIRAPSSGDKRQLDELAEKYGEAAVIDAIRKAGERGGKSVNYVARILEDVGRPPEGRYAPTYGTRDILAELDADWFNSEDF